MYESGLLSSPRSTLVCGSWRGDPGRIAWSHEEIEAVLRDTSATCFIVRHGGRVGAVREGEWRPPDEEPIELVALSPATGTERLGDRTFVSDYGVRFAYMTGAMAKGIACEDLVITLGQQKILGTFGTGGLSLERIETAITKITRELPEGPYVFNLIHGPKELEKEAKIVDLYIAHGIRTIEASSFLNLSPNIVRYRAAGLGLDERGGISIGNRVIVKLSRRELAEQFMMPAPEKIIEQLAGSGAITPLQARLAGKVPVADDITVEADSAGHTDNRPLVALLPSMLMLRDELMKRYAYARRIRVGAAGGISTPHAVLGAFMMGADYVVTGSINQSCVEAATSDAAKELLSTVTMTDIAMAPESDMFEGGFKVQVLKKGSLFPMRAQKLHEIYQRCESLEAIPPDERRKLEQQVFRMPLEKVWEETAAYFAGRDPAVFARASDPKVKMALVFRWYLSRSSRWAMQGDPERVVDYQVWCGPGMGAFNDWVRGTPLAEWRNRRVAEVAKLLMEEAAFLFRVRSLEMGGVPLELDGKHRSVAKEASPA